ncbi:hypothetical protein N7492_007782 [Penicillium capsulatum]|uniref:Uncharacterized protein n=1 Tax=Penicillium capsulatum TaxID=69766 RepID=A0A9W9I4M9_9EURO|nr:hypothetical protein N7492_007782 [Penicillium capsulatum]KAJ6117614.1 hypothetical protein N7512_007339 [Penicillium capsulatum]
MSGLNPFRARNTEGNTAVAASTPDSRGNAPFASSSAASIGPSSSVVPNGYPGKSALSLEIEDGSTSSDDQRTDPFNPDSSVSDNEDEDDDHIPGSSTTAVPHDDRPLDSSGSAPHPASAADGSTAIPSSIPSGMDRASSPTQDTPQSVTGSSSTSPEGTHSTSPSNRSNKERKPPPPPKSHHGKGISGTTTGADSFTTRSRSNHRLSQHGSSPETLASARKAVTPNASLAEPLTQDYFSVSSERRGMIDSTDSLQRSHSQHKRPPTPPLSRRHSQMRRSKSTQSKSSGHRLAPSDDSESNDSSQPSSPGASNRSIASVAQERKRISMPPPSSSDLRAVTSSTGTPPDTSNSPSPRFLQPGRRASSHGSILSGSPSGAPPPPPPRRARDPSTRSSETGSTSQANPPEAELLPQPSNAQDILADLSRLQKEVDDLRGHYENRKVSP